MNYISFKAIDDLLPHVPSNVADAVRPEESDFVTLVKTVFEYITAFFI